jgi:hypothetical protein
VGNRFKPVKNTKKVQKIKKRSQIKNRRKCAYLTKTTNYIQILHKQKFKLDFGQRSICSNNKVGQSKSFVLLVLGTTADAYALNKQPFVSGVSLA